MRLQPTAIAGVVLLEAEPHLDERGSFARTFSAHELAAAGLRFTVAQAALSRNLRRATVRGLHYQAAPRSEAKIVGCLRGRIFDVAVDLRPGSPTRGRHVAVELAGDRLLHIPPGVAHGFQTLEEDSLVSYLISEEYVAGLQRGVRWDDPRLGIDWPLREGVVLSARDRGLPLFSEEEGA